MNRVAGVENEWQYLTGRLDVEPQNTHLLIQRGMVAFKLGRIADAIADFDRAEHCKPELTPYLWQRGLAYYYAERFADGARQFEVDLSVNGHDVEETVWRYLCQAQVHGVQAARASLLPVRYDARPVMGWIYTLFAGERDAETVLAQYRSAGRREQFYSQLYVGLYFEAERDVSQARYYIVRAAEMQVVDDYMGWLAMVHRHLRGWDED